LFFLAWTEASEGNVGRAKALAAQAIRMSPKDRYLGTAHLAFAMSAFIEQDFKRFTIGRNSRFRASHRYRSAVC
jgi:hypothetical protein